MIMPRLRTAGRTGRCLLAATLLAALLIVGVIGCGSGSSTTENGETDVTIGVLAPLTGELGPYGPANAKAASLAVSEIQKAIRKSGTDYSVSAETADTQSNPQGATQAAQQLAGEGANCFVQPDSSSDTLAVANSVSRQQKIPVISAAATSVELSELHETNPYVWRTSAPDNLQGPVLAKVVAEALGGAEGKTVSVAGRNDGYGQGLTEAFATSFRELGGDVQGPLLYALNQGSYDSEAQQIVANNPDAFVIIDFPDTYAKVGPALLRTGGFTPSKLFTSDGLEYASGVAPELLEGARGTESGTPATNKAGDAFLALEKESSGPPPQTFDAQTFDATMVCFLAAAKAGSTDGTKLSEQIRAVTNPPGRPVTYLELPTALKLLREGKDIEYQGVSGPLHINETGDPSSATYNVWKYNDGEVEITGAVESGSEG